jgi:hypothetical protein
VLLRAIAPETIPRNFELFGAIAETHEAEYPKQDTDCLGRHRFDSADIDSLRIVPCSGLAHQPRLTVSISRSLRTQPIAEIHALDVHLAELLASSRTDCECEKDIFDISMAPIVTLDAAQGSNVSGTERGRGTRPQDEQEEAWQPHRGGRHERGRHRGLRALDGQSDRSQVCKCPLQ